MCHQYSTLSLYSTKIAALFIRLRMRFFILLLAFDTSRNLALFIGVSLAHIVDGHNFEYYTISAVDGLLIVIAVIIIIILLFLCVHEVNLSFVYLLSIDSLYI